MDIVLKCNPEEATIIARNQGRVARVGSTVGILSFNEWVDYRGAHRLAIITPCAEGFVEPNAVTEQCAQVLAELLAKQGSDAH